MNFGHLGDEMVHRGHVWHVSVARFESPDGQTFTRDIVRSPGSVGIVALTGEPDDPSVTLVRQYRPAFDAEIVEIPAGMRDIADEPPDDTARRELAEEVGLASAVPLELLTELIPSPGMTDAVCSVYLARDCFAVPNDLQGVEEEHMQVLTLPLADAVAMVRSGEIRDAKSIAGLLLAGAR